MSSGGAAEKKAPKEKQPASFPVGARLKAQRNRHGWELSDVAAWLRIKESYLTAFEEGRISDLPKGAYVTGFLRSYARALGLDADDIASEFQAAMPGVKNRVQSLDIPQPIGGHGIPIGLWGGLGVVVILLAYGAFYRYSGGSAPPSRSVAALPAPAPAPHATGLSPEIAAVIPDAPPQSLSPASQPAATANTDMSAAKAGLPSTGTGLSAPSDNGQADGQMQDTPAARDAAGQIPLAANANGTLPPASTGFAVVASENSWVRVTDRAGHDACNRVLKKGDVCAGDRINAPYRISTGNAGGLVLRFGDVQTAPLGQEHQVIRNLILTQDDIAQGRTPEDVSSEALSNHVTAGQSRPSDAIQAGQSGAQPGPASSDDASMSRDNDHQAKAPSQSVKAAKPLSVSAPKQSESDLLNDRQLGQIKAQKASSPQ